MQPVAYPAQHEKLAQLWRSFMDAGRLSLQEESFLDSAVLQSWRRCALRLDPRAKPRPTKIGEGALTSVLRAQANLITVAMPFLEDIHQFMEGSENAVLLSDGTACITALTGDRRVIEALKEQGLGQGTYWSEGQLGTNALGLCLIEAMPVQVVGAEHYYQAYHHLTSTAAPIHDIRGRIIATIAVVGPAEDSTSQALALVMAAARAISNQLQTDWFLEEANLRLTEVQTILGAISEGVVAWSESGIVQYVNAQAGEILRLNPSSIQGRPLRQAMTLPSILEEAVRDNRELRDVEATFRISGRSDGRGVPCLVSLRPITEGLFPPVGYIAMLRPIEQVRQLVHRQIGVQAALTLDDLASQSPGMRQVLRQARIAARGRAPVLLRGEGGVGKNHLGRAIHNDSERAERPFIVIDCRAIPHELMASEFLGHEKDATTDGRPSKFELANGGTLLLDQVESLSLELQTALLRVLETSHVMRLGSTQPVPLDVRIVAATTADLESRVADGSFIPHLYYRFGVFNIHIPPLRERADDIPLLAERFLARMNQRHDRPYWIDDAASSILSRYPWPGNVRELESVLERAVSHSHDSVVRVTDLPDVVRTGRVMTAKSPRPQPVLPIADAEREAIIRAGWACRGRVTDMARQLGIGRTTLWRKMKRLNISPATFKS